MRPKKPNRVFIEKKRTSGFCHPGRPQNEDEKKRKDRQIPGSRQRTEKKLWNMRVMVLPIVIGALGTVSNGLEKRLARTGNQ